MRLLAMLLMALTNMGVTSPGAELPRGADLVLTHGRIWTGEPNNAASPAVFVEAVAIWNGGILAVGTSEEMRAYVGPNTQEIDLEGRAAVPGFIDAHVHFIQGGFRLLEIDLKNTRSEAEFVERIAERAKTLKPGRWMEGGNWDEEAWPDSKLPTRWMIDSVTSNHPVFLRRYDGHAALANTLALKLAGVTKDKIGRAHV